MAGRRVFMESDILFPSKTQYNLFTIEWTEWYPTSHLTIRMWHIWTIPCLLKLSILYSFIFLSFWVYGLLYGHFQCSLCYFYSTQWHKVGLRLLYLNLFHLTCKQGYHSSKKRWPAAVNTALGAETKITVRNHWPLLWLDYTLLWLAQSSTAEQEEGVLYWLVTQQDPSLTSQLRSVVVLVS